MSARAAAFAIAGLTLAGAVLRAFAATPGFLGDELFTFEIATRGSFGDMLAGVNDIESTPPAYYALAWLTGKVLEAPEWLRLPAVVAGVGLVPVSALVARRAFGWSAAVVCAALVAASPFLVYFGSEARAYAPAALCVMLSTLFLLSALERPRRWSWAGFALSAAAGMWFHYTAAPLLLVQAAWALWAHPELRRPVLLAHVGAGLLYLPWLPFAGARYPLAVAALFNPTELGDRAELLLRPLAGHPHKELWEVPGETLVALAAAAIVIALGCELRRRGTRLPRLRSPAWLLLGLALAGPAWVVVYSALDESVYSSRYLALSAPAALVLLAGLLARRSRVVMLPAAAVLLAVFAVTSVRTSFADLRRPAYDEVAALLDERAGPRDPVIEQPFAPVEGPWRQALSAFLDRPHTLFGADRANASGGWKAAERRGVAYVVYPDTLLLGPPQPPPGTGLEPVARRVWRGTTTLTLVEYRTR